MASTYLSRTPSSAGNRQTFTFSGWIKRTGSEYNTLFSAGTDSDVQGYVQCTIWGDGNDFLDLTVYDSSYLRFRTNQLFRDKSGWYHIVIAVDTTQASNDDRVKIYVNGEQVTSFATYNTMPQNFNTSVNNTILQQVGVSRNSAGSNSNYFNGSMAHVNFIDGTAYDSDTFGETDSTTGIWKPKTAPSVTYGTNGFFLKFENSGAFGTDSSGNSNTFTVNGTMTQTIDTPSNVFATMNPLTSYYAGAWTFSNGNNTVNMGTTSERYVVANMGFSSGKWYWENKYISQSGDTYSRVGIESNINNTAPDKSTSGYGYRGQPAQKVNNNTYTSYGNTYTTGDIIGVAVDMDNNYIYFSKNGVWQNSGDPESGATGTGAAFNIIAPPSGFYFPKIGKEDADTGVWSFNFGNGYFGTTAVSSAQNPDDGIGIFEFSPPTGYKSLCTKSINSQEYD